MLLKHLFVKSNSLFSLLNTEDYNLIRWSVIIILSLNFAIQSFFLDELVLSIISGLIALLLCYLFLTHIIPFFLIQISKWGGGVASKNDLRNVLAISMVPLIPAFLLENYSQIEGYFIRSSELAGFLLQCVFLKILILGIARFNKFSTKESAIVLIIFWVFMNMLGIFIA